MARRSHGTRTKRFGRRSSNRHRGIHSRHLAFEPLEGRSLLSVAPTLEFGSLAASSSGVTWDALLCDASGELFGVEKKSLDRVPATEELGTTQPFMDDIAFWAEDGQHYVFYGVAGTGRSGNSQLYKVKVERTNYRHVVLTEWVDEIRTDNGSLVWLNALGRDPHGNLFAAGGWGGPVSVVPNYVFQIDPVTCEAEIVVHLGDYTSAGDIAFIPNNEKIYLTTTEDLLTISDYLAEPRVDAGGIREWRNDFDSLFSVPNAPLYAIRRDSGEVRQIDLRNSETSHVDWFTQPDNLRYVKGAADMTPASDPPDNQAPTIGSLEDAPDPIERGQTLTLTAAGVTDDHGVDSVSFYRDANGDGEGEANELLGTDFGSEDGWKWSGEVTWGLGEHTYLARATDDGVPSPILQSEWEATTGQVYDPAASPKITVIRPYSGEDWPPGTSRWITWSFTGSPGANVKIELYKGESLNRTIASSTANDGSYFWSIPSSQAVAADYRIKVTSTSNSEYGDFSDYFSICPKPQIIDDVASSFRTVGNWVSFRGQGYNNNVHFAQKGTGSAEATWTFTVTPGTYEVAATWSVHENRATDAPFAVFDDLSKLATVRVNQESAPSDFRDEGVYWKNLGTFTITTGVLKVQLTNDANEYVIADAIRIGRVGDPGPNTEPNRPSCTSPADGAGNLPLTPTLSSSSFADPDIGDSHKATGWQVATDSSFNNLVWDYTDTDSSKTSEAVALGKLSPSTTYYWRMRHQDNHDAWSNWSTDRHFTTGSDDVSQIIDDVASGFRTVGNWVSFRGQGYNNNVHFAQKGTGSAEATWTFTVAPGTYEVAATWSVHENRATDAPFAVFDDLSKLETVRVNQESAPSDFRDEGIYWKNLGTFTITTGVLKVQLTNDANEYVIADAIRVKRVEDSTAVIAVSSPNGGESWQPATTETISWSSTGSPGANVKIELYKGGSLNSTITPSTANDGSYSWSIPSGQAAGADYKIKVTSTSNSSYSDFSNSSFSIGPVVDEPRIVDNGASGFSTVGQWFSFPGKGYKNDVHFAEKGSGSAKASWMFTVEPGQYNVAATWSVHKNRATDAPYTVFSGSTPLQTVDVNQELAPSDFQDEGVNWRDLGTFTITSDTLKVQLSNHANEYVIADAIRIVRVGGP
jgi:Ser-Thr-rich glycosyl-phosphatidyl-inositol-anchored membrane family protein